MVRTITRRPVLFIHVLLCWTWLNLCIQGPATFPTVELQTGYFYPSWIGPVFFCALMYFLMGALLKHSSQMVRQRWYLPIVCVVMMLGAVTFVFLYGYPYLSTQTFRVLYAVGSIFLGISTASVLIELSRIFGNLTPRFVLFYGIVAIVVSALVIFALEKAGLLVESVAFVLIPIPLIASQSRSMKEFPRKALFDRGFSGGQPTPYHFIATAITMGVARGVLATPLNSLPHEQTIVLSLLALLFAAVLAFLGAVIARLNFRHLIYHMGFPIIAFGALLVSITGFDPRLGMVFQLAGFYFSYFIIWGLCAYLIRYFDQSPIWVVGFSTSSLMFGQFLGGVVSCLLQESNFGLSTEILETLVAFALLMVGLFIVNKPDFSKGWGTVQPADEQFPDDALSSCCHRISVLYGLTSREDDVFRLLAKGRSRGFIQQDLVISDNTTKAHIKNIYRKLGVHSHQELLDMVEKDINEHQKPENRTLE